MNTTHLLGSLGLLCAATAASPIFAEVGMRDGADQFGEFKSARTRTDVQTELRNANGEGTSVTVRDGDEKRAGAYGVAGSRYSIRTRDEVRSELKESGMRSRHDIRNNLYFGD